MLEARRQQGGGSLHYPNMQLLDRLSQHDRLSQLSKLSQLSQHDTKPGNYPGYRPQTQGALAMVSSFLQVTNSLLSSHLGLCSSSLLSSPVEAVSVLPQGCPTVTSPDPVSSSSSPQKVWRTPPLTSFHLLLTISPSYRPGRLSEAREVVPGSTPPRFPCPRSTSSSGTCFTQPPTTRPRWPGWTRPKAASR